MITLSYCAKCGGTGYLIDGTPCDCKSREDDLYMGMECMEIPETYRGLKFEPLLLPNKLGDIYKNYMNKVFNDITSLRWKGKNELICAPAQSGKSVLAYCCMQTLFRKDIDVFPMYDVLELKKMMMDIEYGRLKDNGRLLYESPYIFAYIPPILNFDVFDTVAMLVARRVRRGNSTILLYSGNWEYLKAADQKGSLRNMEGTGSLTTIHISNFHAEN